ncbi:PREDICTED: uncharacterized protein LOC109154131 [Ipomoea nil]|uniref:uncharacterized protein LOC109154131 n=1 Tax=Ipomoea nil TaxID=35883 RepID=UPI000900AB38|nr:PREDICTED: uncharacterized protein LOC109154131 [Ipomoea nil]XP_019157543.1 PREDICTED: uncharacterized protein LOC109154131 [Ipomoea nil]XP_019157544.1 PREDICTED: uncharacterized protein LOC109154131 [Ipomoea nil]
MRRIPELMTNTRRDYDEAARHITEIQEQMQAMQAQMNDSQRAQAETLGAFQTGFQAFQTEVRQWMRNMVAPGPAILQAGGQAQHSEAGSTSVNPPTRVDRPSVGRDAQHAIQLTDDGSEYGEDFYTPPRVLEDVGLKGSPRTTGFPRSTCGGCPRNLFGLSDVH